MKYFKFIKISLFLFVLFLLSNCGYQPLFNKEAQSFSISNFNLEGNKRLGGLLKNNLITVKKDQNKLTLSINSKKKTSVADKSMTGKVLTNALTIEFEISASDMNNNVVFSKIYTKTKNYSSADIHTDTLNNEKKLTESLIEIVANELQTDLNSIYRQ